MPIPSSETSSLQVCEEISFVLEATGSVVPFYCGPSQLIQFPRKQFAHFYKMKILISSGSTCSPWPEGFTVASMTCLVSMPLMFLTSLCISASFPQGLMGVPATLGAELQAHRVLPAVLSSRYSVW